MSDSLTSSGHWSPLLRAADILAIQGRPYSNIASYVTDPHDLFGPLNIFLGYLIAIAAIAMLAYTVSPAIHDYIAALN
jgi:hypothetical protein